MDKIKDLLHRLLEYMENRSDADGDSEGYSPNEEMKFSLEIKDVLYEMGETEQGDVARASVDPKYGMWSLNESMDKVKSDFERFIKYEQK